MRKEFLKYLTLAMLASSFMVAAYAEDKATSGSVGNYFGIQMGSSNVNSSDQYLPDDLGNIVLVKPSNNGFGLRLFWGYQFSNYIGLESGYDYYSASTYNIPNGNSTELRIQALDLLGKGILPLPHGWNLYAKGGAAIVFYKEGGLLAPTTEVDGTDGSSGITIRPEVGAGVSYNFTPNWAVDVSATRILKGGIVPNADLFSIGISYHAVDLYCGQFLC